MKKILSLIILSSLLPALNPQEASSKPNLLEANEPLLTQTAQASTRTIEYRWPQVYGTATSFEIPSDYRAVTYNAGEKFVEGQSYNDVHILVLSPEEYELWQRNPSQGLSRSITVNVVFDQEQWQWRQRLPSPSGDLVGEGRNQNRHPVSIYDVSSVRDYLVSGSGDYLSQIFSSTGVGMNTVEVVFDERQSEVAEMILNTLDFFPR